MKKEEIHLDDIRRILFGTAPPEFLIEVFVRTIIVYLFLVLIVRLLGKRTNAQLTITERAVFVTLGAIVAMPMQGPPTGILVGIVILICILFFQRTLTLTFFYSGKWEQLMQGRTRLIVKDSVIIVDELKNLKISQKLLFEELRNENIRHLGQVKRVYLEGCGTFSIYKNKEIVPGLSVLPDEDSKTIGEKDTEDNVCTNCGTLQHNDKRGACPNCNNIKWTKPSKN
jgi:uncharacterized membrane protein YcaP (DUF421 family)